MALVFKVKFQDTLRRWVAPEASNVDSFALTFNDLESKIRELFHLSSATSLAITYVDKDNDVVTLADDQDLIDACFVQHLNPLRLDVRVLNGSSKEHVHDPLHSSEHPSISAVENLNLEAFLSALPQATADSAKEFLRIYSPFIDPKLPAAACLKNIESVFKDFVNGLASHHHGDHKFAEKRDHKFGEKPPHHVNRHHHGDSKFGEKPPHHANMHHHGDPKFGEKPPHHANRHHWSSTINPWHGDTTLHCGVECDGCGTSPIEGSRYKSTKESDYDLCETCFKAMGNESDYLKLDLPVHRSPPHGHYRPPCLRKGPKPFMPIMAPAACRASFARGPYGWKPSHPFIGHQSSIGSPFDEHKKLDARFVKDITIFDGTEFAPGTKFTKIWRMSNIGTLPWPQGTRLVHIGGDVLGTDKAVILELPESGVPCGEEVEVSVDLAAPEKAGRYVSHWRLSAPSGQKFGHRVWVVIQVVPHGEHSPQFLASMQVGEKGLEASEVAIALDNVAANTRRVDVGVDKGLVDVVVDSALGVVKQVSLEKSSPADYENSTRILYPDPTSLHMEDEAEKPNTKRIDVNMDGAGKVLVDVVVDSVTGVVQQVSLGKSRPADYENSTRILYPDPTSFHMKDEAEKPKLEVDGFSLVEKPSESTDWFDVSDQGVDESEVQKESLVEEVPQESLLQALEAMGFTDRTLNIPILRNCNFKLEKTVDYLLVAAGWDGVLKDLEEMGFNDKTTSVRVLVKNKGSLKQTVKDLVKLEKQ